MSQPSTARSSYLTQWSRYHSFAALGFTSWLAVRYILSTLGDLLENLFPKLIPGISDPERLGTKRDDFSTTNDKTYDYIIVGGGTAGCVLASRLSEDPEKTVLVLEAGYSDLLYLFSRIPAGSLRTWRTACDWIYRTEDEPELGFRRLYLPRGKCLGGSSSINAQMYQHCAPESFSKWGKGWQYSDLKQYFRKSECFTPSMDPDFKMTEKELKNRGDSGPWQINYSWVSTLTKVFMKACVAAGHPAKKDINVGDGDIGVTKIQTFISPNGRRSSSSAAYLSGEVLARRNLTVGVGMRTTRILFDIAQDGSARASGVEFAQTPQSPAYAARASREVIVCSGAYNTPQLLMLSGIGPEKHLRDHKVPLVKGLPGVGQNLYDHLNVPLIYRTRDGSSMHFLLDDIKSIPALVQWLRTGTGPLCSNGSESAVFMRSSEDENFTSNEGQGLEDQTGPGEADMEIFACPLGFKEHGATIYGQGDYITLSPTHLKPTSVGSVTLRHTAYDGIGKGDDKMAKAGGVWDMPVINHNYLKTENDRKVLVYGLKKAREIARQSPLKEQILYNVFPGPHVDRMTDADLLAHVRAAGETLYHPVGTCKIGDIDTDVKAVVDRELKVHGVQGLRVCDASVFPTILAGHPCAAVCAIAEKAADMIKLEHR